MLRAALPLSTSRLPRGKTFSYFRLSKNLSILNIVASPALVRFITYSSYHICYAYIHICCTMYNVLSLLGTILSIYLLPFHWFSLIPSCAVQTHMHVIPYRAPHKFPFWQLWARDGARRFHWFIGSISILQWFDFWLLFHPFPPLFLPQGEVSLSFWDLQYYTMILCRSCRMGRFQENTTSSLKCKIKFKKMFSS